MNGISSFLLRHLRRAKASAVPFTPVELMPIIVGAPRSGTTLLRFMLDSHPQLAIPPETGFLPFAGERQSPQDLLGLITSYPPDAPAWEDFGVDRAKLQLMLDSLSPFHPSDGVRAFYALYAARQNKKRYGDKTPMYCEHIPAIRKLLPEARFVHVIRDGRDVALSLRKVWFAPGKDMPTLASFWRRMVRSARAAGAGMPDYEETRYEDLVRDPRPRLERACGMIGLEFYPSMLDYWRRAPERLTEHRARRRLDGSLVVTHEQRLDQQRLTMQPPRPERCSRWREEMTLQEQSEFLAVAGDLLEELGYET